MKIINLVDIFVKLRLDYCPFLLPVDFVRLFSNIDKSSFEYRGRSGEFDSRFHCT